MINPRVDTPNASLRFLHGVYEDNGVDVREPLALDDVNAVMYVTRLLLARLKERGDNFPIVQLEDPGKYVESIGVQIVPFSFATVERTNALPHERHVTSDIEAYVDVRSPRVIKPGYFRPLSGLLIKGRNSDPFIDLVRLHRPTSEVVDLKQGVPDNEFIGDAEAMKFVSIVDTYLERLPNINS